MTHRDSRRSSRHLLALATAACLLLGAACGGPEVEPQPQGLALELTFDFLEVGPLSAGPVTLEDAEGRAVEADVLSDGGSVAVRPGASAGAALAFSGEEVVAALRVDLPDPDDFSPGEGSFTLSADVAWEGAGDDQDTGANVVQRGLFRDTGQYKLQLDAGRPSCRVAGTTGAVLVKADASVSLGEWYRLRCQRKEDVVTLTVQPWEGEQWGDAETFTGSGSIGAVEFSSSTPLAVGGKLSADGSLVPQSPDQFHGLIDGVAVEVE